MRREDSPEPMTTRQRAGTPRPGDAAERVRDDRRPERMSRRGLLAAGAAAATGALAPAVGRGAAGIAAPQTTGAGSLSALGWQPRFLDPRQARLLTQLCELVLPRTTTPGAADAGVAQWIDLALSVAEPEEQLTFLGGLDWIERRARAVSSRSFLELSADAQAALLREISDEHEEPPEELEAGAAFFRELKSQTLFAYFTSKTGRVEMLGLPPKVEREIFEGCRHDSGDDHG